MKLATLLLFSATALAADLRGRLVGNVVLNATDIPLEARVVLDYGAKSARFLADGSFEITGVPSGQHVLEPLVPGYRVQPVIVTVPEEGDVHVQKFDAAALPLAVSAIPSLPYPLQLAAVGKDEYYTAPPGMNIMGMLKSPMILLMLASLGMAFALPKITEMLDADPEMAKQMLEQRQGWQRNLDFSDALSSKLAGGGGADAQAGSAAPAAAAGPPVGKAPARTPQGSGKRGGKRK
ncbi:ER membrane protein complex subunit 7 [Vanrija pseudolonga]|uniref:ER membrane protein complex subunit 7 n=1 Tax=Vanrija pseudolonga TaxID=143232 RepID=A0AAF0Y3T1_9TREE|nr:ER membrane protein complex subunit 7 [Vanrija pseudolonga]